MASSKSKRDLGDFFKPYARPRFLPLATVPQKRPSPPPDNQASPRAPTKRSTPPRNHQLDGTCSPAVARPRSRPSTPPGQSFKSTRQQSPKTPPISAITTPSSTRLPIRTPQTVRTIRTSKIYVAGPNFVKTPNAAQPVSRSRPSSPSPEQLPQLSKANISSIQSTQQVMEEGRLVAVRDSDEESSASLASLSDLFGKKQDNATLLSGIPEDADELEMERTSTLKLFLNGRTDPAVAKKKLRDILALKTSGKRDARKFLDRQRCSVEDTRKLDQLRDYYEATMREADANEQKINLGSKLEDFMDDTEDADKVFAAVRRTEALSEETGYSFYGRRGMRDLARTPVPVPKYPHDGVPYRLFQHWNKPIRSKQFLAGMMSHLAGQNEVKADALKWTFKAFICEPDMTLRLAYITTLEASAEHWVRNGIRPHDVQLAFYSLAADMEEMADSAHFQPRPLPVIPAQTKAQYLVSTLDLFAKISSHMSFESLSVLGSILCQIAIDSALMGIACIASSVEDVFDHILGRYCEEEIALHVASHIVTTVSQALQEANLQARLLEHVRPTSRVAVNVRITLAHAFLLGVSGLEPLFIAARPPSVDLPRLINLLAISDDFATARLRRVLNYGDLRARTVLLDIAIADGGRPLIFPSIQYPTVREFNHQIDAIAAAVRRVWAAIADTGATHMTRTEAKEKLDCVYHRLLYVVRTEPPPKKHIFDQVTGKYGAGDEMRSTARGRETMKTFLARAENARQPTVVADEVKEVKMEPIGMGNVTTVQQELTKEEQEDGSGLLSPPPAASAGRTMSNSSSVGGFVDALEHQAPLSL